MPERERERGGGREKIWGCWLAYNEQNANENKKKTQNTKQRLANKLRIEKERYISIEYRYRDKHRQIIKEYVV